MYLASMGLITIKIDKVIIQQEDNKKLDEIIELLKELTDENKAADNGQVGRSY
jgi:hypothetical protein